MKVLVIPDVHLKPWMFSEAERILRSGRADRTVCLMDIADDFDKGMHINLYEETYDAAISLAKEFPNTLWCCGNHDLSYDWGYLETGYSPYAESTVIRKLSELQRSLQNDLQFAYVHRIDNVLFSHGGVTQEFVREHISARESRDIDLVLDVINALGKREMWKDNSPIWARPQSGDMKMYQEKQLLQVVGHTPVERITQMGNLISCDVFSTYRDGSSIGTEEFLLIDTKTWEWEGISSNRSNRRLDETKKNT
ncbi:MAG: metallophosphoesterase [Lachnospiraceae bacterium]|nr:metallophosphoesterase [Lachnospiraceae bacterium]